MIPPRATNGLSVDSGDPETYISGLAFRSPAPGSESDSLSSPESTSAQTISFGIFASLEALAAIYISYRQLRAIRYRCSSAPKRVNRVDVICLSDLRYPAYRQNHGSKYIRGFPGDDGYIFQVTRLQTVQQYVRPSNSAFRATLTLTLRRLTIRVRGFPSDTSIEAMGR